VRARAAEAALIGGELSDNALTIAAKAAANLDAQHATIQQAVIRVATSEQRSHRFLIEVSKSASADR
jgi:hypothetical protein